MGDNKSCSCGKNSNDSLKLVFSCSGAADVGEIADRASRIINKQKTAKMFCLAGLGGQVDGMIKFTEDSDKILVIDGCAVNCGKKVLEHIGINKFEHIMLKNLGLEKNHSDANTKNIQIVVDKANEILK